MRGANVATPVSWTNGKPGTAKAFAACGLLGLFIGLVQSQSRPGSSREDDVPTAHSTDPAGDMRNAAEAMERGDYHIAGMILENLGPYYGNNSIYHLRRAESALHTNHFDRAREAIAAARRLDPDNIVVDICDAILSEKLGDFPKAKEILDRVLTRHPDETRALLPQARIAERLGDRDAALRTWRKLLTLLPAYGDGLVHYSLLLWKTGDHEGADKAILDAIHSQPAPSALLESALSSYYSGTGRFSEAAEAAARAMSLAPNAANVAHQNAMAQARAGNIPAAIDIARQMTRQFPKQASGWEAMAVIAASSGDSESAEHAFQQWFKLEPNSSAAHASYGFFLYKTGKTSAARALLEKASRTFPGDGAVWMNYAVVLDAQGEKEAAKAARRKANALMTDEAVKGLLR